MIGSLNQNPQKQAQKETGTYGGRQSTILMGTGDPRTTGAPYSVVCDVSRIPLAPFNLLTGYLMHR